MSDIVNQNPKKRIIWILTIRGFGSEINNLIYSINYTKQKNIKLGVMSTYWNFKYNQGLKDYFLFEEYNDSRINSLLFLYKGLIQYLYAFRKLRLSELTEQAIDVLTGQKKDKNIFKENLLNYSFEKMKTIFGIKDHLIFEVYDEVRLFNSNQRSFDRKKFILLINAILMDFWKFTPDTSQSIENKKRELKIENLENYAVFHIRRGDKVAQASIEDRVYEVEEYIQKLEIIAPSIRTIFLMTDDYNVFLEIQQKYLNYRYYTLSDPISQGHDQDTFNKSSRDKKRRHAIDLLTELEIARKGEIFIGSSGSNIFRLIEYFKIEGCYDLSENSNEL